MVDLIDNIDLSVPGRPEYIPALKVAVAALAESNGFSDEAIEDINISMLESCKSIVCHGDSGFCKEFTVKASCTNDELEIKVFTNTNERVSNNGIKLCKDCPREGDIGELILKSLMDYVKIDKDPDGNGSIVMVKKNGRSSS